MFIRFLSAFNAICIMTIVCMLDGMQITAGVVAVLATNIFMIVVIAYQNMSFLRKEGI